MACSEVSETIQGVPGRGRHLTLRWCGRYRGYRSEFKVICHRTTSPLGSFEPEYFKEVFREA